LINLEAALPPAGAAIAIAINKAIGRMYKQPFVDQLNKKEFVG
jgi:CO/xanthine dehydrogenase Mo-binding subunit